MDYKKTNAPTNTVTRNLMELCEDTGNIYETVSIIGERANQIAAEMKNDFPRNCWSLLLITITLKRCLKTENRLKSLVIMKNSRNRR